MEVIQRLEDMRLQKFMEPKRYFLIVNFDFC